MKILNLFAGVGGNRSVWGDKHQVTAIEQDQAVAWVYFCRFSKDRVIVGDAYDYVLKHFRAYDFIWASPPCKTHTILNRLMVATPEKGYVPKLPDLRLYSLIIFFQEFFKGLWIVENVKPYYDPIIRPDLTLGRHIFWCNFHVDKKTFIEREHYNNLEQSASVKGIDLQFIKKIGFKGNRLDYLLRNAVNPKISAHIFKFVEGKRRIKQVKLTPEVLETQC